MIKYSAHSVGAACTDTRIDTLVTHASAVSRTFRADDAFGPAACGTRVAARAART